MTDKSINSVLKEALTQVKPSAAEMKEIKARADDFQKRIEKNRKKERINAEIFVGGSEAKGTMIKKYPYDIDIFIRFDKKYKDNLLSDITEKILKGERAERIHGSRDYFRIKNADNIFFEIIPVRKIKNPREAENVTDLSYSHVNYMKKKLRSEKILDEIMIAKAFCYANGVYGAESYVQGFSGYAIELLVYHYKGFLGFVKAMTKIKDKEVIDIEKLHKNKSSILMDLNSAKLKSPIILIDPTYKQRNVVAALSYGTFRKFQATCKDFLKKPSIDFFRQKVIDIEKMKADAKKKSYEFVLLRISTNKQEGDVAGSKLLKFCKHLNQEAGKFFEIKAEGFEYGKGKNARAFFIGKKKTDILIIGPEVKDEKNVRKFRLKHKTITVKNGRIYSKLTVKSTLKEFLENWVEKNKKKIQDMDITRIEIID